MTISRRPNNRPSTEKAPGPSKAMAAAMMNTPTATSLASFKAKSGAGNHAIAIPKKQSPTSSPASGVKIPTARAVPLAANTKPTNEVRHEELASLAR